MKACQRQQSRPEWQYGGLDRRGSSDTHAKEHDGPYTFAALLGRAKVPEQEDISCENQDRDKKIALAQVD